MKTIEEYDMLMRKKLSSKRYLHSVGVAHMAASLAMQNGYEPNAYLIAGILHDCAKEYTDDELNTRCSKLGDFIFQDEFLAPGVLHAPYGAFLAETEYEMTDPEILSAIRYHSIGKANMSHLEKAIMVSDFLEPSRKQNCYPALNELRKLAYSDLDLCTYLVACSTKSYILSCGGYFVKEAEKIIEYYKKENIWQV